MEHLLPAHEFLLDMVDAVAAGQNLPEIPTALQEGLDELNAQLSDMLAAQHMSADEELVLASLEELEAAAEGRHQDDDETAVEDEVLDLLAAEQSVEPVPLLDIEALQLDHEEFDLPSLDELEAAVEAQETAELQALDSGPDESLDAAQALAEEVPAEEDAPSEDDAPDEEETRSEENWAAAEFIGVILIMSPKSLSQSWKPSSQRKHCSAQNRSLMNLWAWRRRSI